MSSAFSRLYSGKRLYSFRFYSWKKSHFSLYVTWMARAEGKFEKLRGAHARKTWLGYSENHFIYINYLYEFVCKRTLPDNWKKSCDITGSPGSLYDYSVKMAESKLLRVVWKFIGKIQNERKCDKQPAKFTFHFTCCLCNVSWLCLRWLHRVIIHEVARATAIFWNLGFALVFTTRLLKLTK